MDKFADTVAKYFAAIRETDTNAWVQLFAKDGVSHDPIGMASYTGHEQLEKFFTGINKAFAKVSFVEENTYVCGHNAAVKWNATGTGHNGVEVAFHGIDTFEMNENGEIVELKAYWDLQSVMAKLKG